ncbi:similar to Saccharomyces cerevisiae YRF1 Y' element ATP-dependent helicase protein (partial), partial [Maudiozyma saulgeensis]
MHLTSGPARFPELLVLKYAGNDRNIFVDPVTRTIEIHFKYAKSRSFPHLIRCLDRLTSAYLLHFILIERFMMRECLTMDYKGASRDLFGDLSEEDKLYSIFMAKTGNTSMSDVEFPSNVLQSFLFFDPVTGGLISRKKFSKFYTLYPNIGNFTAATRLTLREMRQCIVALIRYCLPNDGIDPLFMAAKEFDAGHGLSVGASVYAVDNFSGLGNHSTPLTDTILKICRAWQAWLNLGGEEETRLKESVENFKVLDVRGSANDLIVAGKSIFGDQFAFRENQEKLIMDIYLSNRKFFPVQALPGFGKTAMFQIPLSAIKMASPRRRVVSFVLVPYISLMANMVERLTAGGLVAAPVKDVLVMNAAPEEHTLQADIYVYSYEDVRSSSLVTMINNWYYHYRSTFLGYIIVDEVHNLGCQDFRTGVTAAFPLLKCHYANKVLLLSGSVGKDRFGIHLGALNIKVQTTTEVEVNDKVYIHNLVKDI